jgi:hypothetical protein
MTRIERLIEKLKKEVSLKESELATQFYADHDHYARRFHELTGLRKALAWARDTAGEED